MHFNGQSTDADSANHVIQVLQERVKRLKEENQLLRSNQGTDSKDSSHRSKTNDATGPTRRSKSTGQVPEWSFSSFLASLSLLDILANGFNKDRPSNKTEAQWAKDLSEEQVSQALDQTMVKTLYLGKLAFCKSLQNKLGKMVFQV